MLNKNFYRLLTAVNDNPYLAKSIDGVNDVACGSLAAILNTPSVCGLAVSTATQTIGFTNTTMNSLTGIGYQTGSSITKGTSADGRDTLLQTVSWTNNTGSAKTIKSLAYGRQMTYSEPSFFVPFLMINLDSDVVVANGETLSVTFKIALG